jgi:hypothetical protein
MVGITLDVLKHASILFFQGTVSFRFSKSTSLPFYNNSYFNALV